jgi:hypothetical protein
MPEIGTSGLMSEAGNGVLPHGPSHRACPRLYIYAAALQERLIRRRYGPPVRADLKSRRHHRRLLV